MILVIFGEFLWFLVIFDDYGDFGDWFWWFLVDFGDFGDFLWFRWFLVYFVTALNKLILEVKLWPLFRSQMIQILSIIQYLNPKSHIIIDGWNYTQLPLHTPEGIFVFGIRCYATHVRETWPKYRWDGLIFGTGIARGSCSSRIGFYNDLLHPGLHSVARWVQTSIISGSIVYMVLVLGQHQSFALRHTSQACLSPI